MCLLSITENGEVSVCSGQGRLDRGPSSLGAELTLLLPTGLIPKDYRSLKTQYLQSYGPEHLLTFHNLKRIGLLTEQSAAETLTAVESRVSKLVTDRAAAESQPSAPGELGAQPCPAGSCCSRAGWKHAAKVDTAGTELRAGQSFGPWEQQGWQERSQMHLILWPERAIFQLEARSWGWYVLVELLPCPRARWCQSSSGHSVQAGHPQRHTRHRARAAVAVGWQRETREQRGSRMAETFQNGKGFWEWQRGSGVPEGFGKGKAVQGWKKDSRMPEGLRNCRGVWGCQRESGVAGRFRNA
ncbi:uncharacterized protein LOC128850888 isoform X1 [Cuculus canorus]|uniref:uncharacterized protein LOC128850888 isoform X1 n=1 Tax=Cuculus canorus TaxID=55661 RepID=UPI0023AA9988|nr:uncharacterized protein LOC128850888 isoform X1 [Cuculus canorus]XP_053911882.1 uncharacterized protein LOC128850888 isoform X1 [Cuculus canorus]